MVLLQGKVTGCLAGWSGARGESLWTDRSLKFFACLSAFNGGCENITLVEALFVKML